MTCRVLICCLLRNAALIWPIMALVGNPCHADGPADNRPDKVRPVPPPGIEVSRADREELEQGLAVIGESLKHLADRKDPRIQRLLPDVEKGAKRHLALEVLWNIYPIASAIRLGKLESVDNYLITNREDGIWLSVEDTGIGMSEAVLTGSLLDFGASFWGSTRMVEEFPGLAAKGMASLGKFGIGFFSVFMLGDHVRVITRRPDRAESDALLLEFQDGIGSHHFSQRPRRGRSRPMAEPAWKSGSVGIPE